MKWTAERKAALLRMRDETGATFAEIGVLFGISGQRVRDQYEQEKSKMRRRERNDQILRENMERFPQRLAYELAVLKTIADPSRWKERDEGRLGQFS